MPLARADLESLLRTRKLDRTLTTALPGLPEIAVASTGIDALDAIVGGGLPRGQVSEIVGSRSSGRTSLMLQLLASATARGELVAFVSALVMLEFKSAVSAGIDLTRMLWVRGHVVTNPGMCRDMNQRALEQAIRALALILQAGNFGLVVFDAAEAPAEALRRLPFTTWLRLQRIVEGSQTTCLLVGGETMARSSAGLTLRTGVRDMGLGVSKGVRFQNRLFAGLNVSARVVRARTHSQEDAAVALATAATNCA